MGEIFFFKKDEFLRGRARLSLVVAGRARGYPLAAVCRLVAAVASLAAEHRLWSARLSCLEASGTLDGQGIEL